MKKKSQAKTHKATKKRVKTTGSGKKLVQKAARRHLLSNKKTRRDHPGSYQEAPKSREKQLNRLLPNG